MNKEFNKALKEAEQICDSTSDTAYVVRIENTFYAWSKKQYNKRPKLGVKVAAEVNLDIAITHDDVVQGDVSTPKTIGKWKALQTT